MSYDLVLKDSKHNWARGACCSPISATARLTAASTAAAPKPPTLAELNLTPDEKKKLAGVAAIKKASQSGDKHAQRQWKKAPKIIAKLKAKAAKGDPKAQRSLQIMRAAKMFAPGAVLLGKDEILGREFIRLPGKAEHGHLKIMGAYATQILGSDLNDDEAAVARDGGQCEEDSLSRMRGQYPQYPYQPSQYRGRRGKVKHLKSIVQRSVQGDASAQAQLQQIQTNLQNRANAGDTKATQVLNKITQWQAKFQAQYGTTATPATTYPAPYQAPYTPPAPAPYYPGSATPGDSESELDASDPEL